MSDQKNQRVNRMTEHKIVKITDPEQIKMINKLLDDKRHIHEKIREGKINEIRTEIKFIKWPTN